MRKFSSACLISGISLVVLWPGVSSGRRDDSTDLEELQRVQESNNAILAETVQKLGTIQIDVQAMKGALEENRHFFEQESKKNEQILKDFDLRLTGMEERLSLFEGQIQELMSKGEGKPASAGEEGALYRKALAEINTQNYKSAMPLLDQFIKKYPKSSMADNAQYWKGEALYGLKQFPEAVLEFQKVVKKYPKSEKAPAAVLKQGYCFFEVKEYLDAKAFLQKVIAQYPTSEEASKARAKIQQIDEMVKAGPRPGGPTSPARPQ